MFLKIFFHWLPILIACNTFLYAQQTVNVTYSADEIALNEVFLITLTVNGDKVKQVSNFPEIADFAKSNTTYSKEKKQYFIKQYYKPRKKGTFELSDFYIAINQKKHFFKGRKLKVKSTNSKINTASSLPDVAYTEVKPHCELNIKLSKNVLFQTQSCLLTVSFQIREDNQVELNFIDLKEQLQAIANAVRPANTWVQDLSSLKEIRLDSSSKFNKQNPTYILYQGYISPIDTGAYRIPALKFKVLKYGVFKSPTEVRRKETVFLLTTDAVSFKALPMPSEIENYWVAGNFYLQEHLIRQKYMVNKAFNFSIIISQQGATGILPEPKLRDNKKFNIFAPQVTEKMQYINQQYVGSKSFRYTIVPKVEGTIDLADVFYWTYFNTTTQAIDTLKPRSKVQVVENKNNSTTAIDVDESGDWNELLNKSSHKIVNLEQDPRLKWVSNILIILMLIVTLYIILKK